MKIKNQPLVSVVIPTFNHSNYLGKAISSVIDQTYKNWELLIIDNYSTDNTKKVINSFNDRRIKSFLIKNFGIIAKSRNAGILAAKGEWIAFLDSDDWWEKNKLQKCTNLINNKVDLIYHDLLIESYNRPLLTRKLIKSRKLQKPILIDLLENGNAISNSSVIVRKKILKKVGLIDESKELVAAEDYNTWLKIADLTNQFLYMPEILGYYSMHNQSISKKDMAPSIKYAIKNFLPKLNNKQKIKIESNIKYLSGRFYYLNYEYVKSRNNLLFTLRNGSFSLRFKSLFMIIMLIFK